MTIANHQNLLDKYASAERAVIAENSSDIQYDMDKLYKEIFDYAEMHNLVCPPYSDFGWESAF